jgi:hypothetical protein
MARRKRLGHIEGLAQEVVRMGPWVLDDDDFWLAALLQDSVYASELLWDDPTNHPYGGCYRVRDYQYEFDRPKSNYEGFACARSVGKTESIKRKTFTHVFRRHGENLLLTAPELIHLLPLTDAIEDRIRDTRLTREFLDYRGGKSGFTHRPFGVDYVDNTKIVGRIPRLTGTGVKGQHQPDLIVDEAQDYPERGWIEVHETVMKDHIDFDGNPDFYYCFYGVHSGARESGFHKRVSQGAFRIVQVTAMQRTGWGVREKEAAKAAYGGTSSPDYRRNILGEAGSAASAFFVISRLVACMDQDRESDFNTVEYRAQDLRAEEVAELDLPMIEVLDLPSGYGKVWGGMDVGLTNSPTVVMLFAEVRDRKKRERLKLIRRITMERFRTRTIRESLYAIDNTYGSSLQGFGMDVTGLGFPMWQEMEDDEAVPAHLKDVARGYFFNAKVPVQVDKEFVSHDKQGRMRDQYGSAVKIAEDPLSGTVRYITEMPMLEASTRYLREWVDSGYLWLPFDTAISTDFLGETQQRVKRTGELRKKPNMFHILDATRAMAMVRRAEDIEAALAPSTQVPVLDIA